MGVLQREKELIGSSILRVFIHSLKMGTLGEDLNGIFTSFPGVSLQGRVVYCLIGVKVGVSSHLS